MIEDNARTNCLHSVDVCQATVGTDHMMYICMVRMYVWGEGEEREGEGKGRQGEEGRGEGRGGGKGEREEGEGKGRGRGETEGIEGGAVAVCSLTFS